MTIYIRCLFSHSAETRPDTRVYLVSVSTDSDQNFRSNLGTHVQWQEQIGSKTLSHKMSFMNTNFQLQPKHPGGFNSGDWEGHSITWSLSNFHIVFEIPFVLFFSVEREEDRLSNLSRIEEGIRFFFRKDRQIFYVKSLFLKFSCVFHYLLREISKKYINTCPIRMLQCYLLLWPNILLFYFIDGIIFMESYL